MKTLKLTKYEVDISEDKMTWGQKEIVRFTFIEPNTGKITAESMLNSKIKRFEYAIKEIREGDKKIPFSSEWVMGLCDEDGTLLVSEINEIDQKKNTELTDLK